MPQDIYFPRWPALVTVAGVYDISSVLLLCGIAIFCVIIGIALVALYKITIQIRTIKREHKAISYDMETFYKKQLKLIQGKPFLQSLSQYVKLLSELHHKNIHSLRRELGYDALTIQYIENVLMGEEQLDSAREKRIKDVLHQHII